MDRRAKIVCTLGPASSAAAQVDALVRAGMDVARLNLSHGTRADHEAAYRAVRAATDATGRAVGVLADLQGPKIRLGPVVDGPVLLSPGQPFVVTTEPVPGDEREVSTTYAGLPGDVRPDERILVDDGRVVLRVVGVDGPRVRTEVEVGGAVSSHKGLNLPGVAVSVPALGPKDEDDLRWALRLGVDLVALSFVRHASDVDDVRRVMAEEGVTRPVLAKIEKPEAVRDVEAVVRAFDGVMVARGDLGVELPLERVPMVQKRVVQLARLAGKPVIVATQMLESMVSAARPTRAEVSDVANAVLDGTDAVMLSAETSVGHDPVAVVRTMASIVAQVEAEALDRVPLLPGRPSTVGGVIGRAAVDTGLALGAQALVAFTETGTTVRRLARYRCGIPLLAFTPVQAVRSQLALSWGVETFLVPYVRDTDEVVRQVDAALLAIDRVHAGDLVVVVCGSPPGRPGSTNTMRVHRVGES